jgi:hypothetical protein
MANKNIPQQMDFGTALLAGGREGLRNVLIFNAITHVVPAIGNVIGNVAKSIVRRKIERHITQLSGMATKQRKASIRLFRDYDKEHVSTILFDAVLSYVSELPQTKHVKRTPSGIFIMATDEEIEISPSIFVKKVNEKLKDDDKLAQLVIDVYSYDYDLIHLRKFVDELEAKYNMALANQLGKNIFYFDEIPVSLPMRLDKKPDLTKAPKNLMFSSYVLYTNKSLRNLYGDSVRLIKKRVHFFLNNKRWYEDKGVPYTLGILLHGVPGAGKTSTIKSIAKDTNRHVLNIKLSSNTTVSQLNNLFYSSQVHIVQNGVNKVYDIPIDKRIIVIEDIDCLTDVVLERGSINETKKQKETESTTNANNNTMLQQFSMGASGDTGDNEKLTLSTVLNILDGVLEQPGRIIIMTSNHPEKLDRALLRPGRIDVIVRFDFCKTHEMKEIVEAFIETVVPTEDALKFVGGQYTPAEVTQIIFECIEDHKEMFKRLSTPKVVEIENSPESAQEISLGIQVDERIDAVDVEQVHSINELVSTDIIKNDIIPNSGVYTSPHHKTIYDRYDGRNELPPELVDGVLNDFESCGVVAGNSNMMDTNDLSAYFNPIGENTPSDTQNKDEYIATQGDKVDIADMMKNRLHKPYHTEMYDNRNVLTPALDEVLNEFQSCGVVAGNSNNMMDLNDLSCCFEPIGLNFPPGI